MDIREYICHSRKNVFFVDCDATDYPDVCPYCQISIDPEFDRRDMFTIDYSGEYYVDPTKLEKRTA